MISVVFLVSGNGGTLKFLDQGVHSGIIKNIEIKAVISDRECDALNYAEKRGIFNQKVDYIKNKNQKLVSILETLNPDFIVTTFYKILDENIVAKFRNKLINLHYSLLPAFKGLIGMSTVEEALKLKSKFIGGTCHFVDEFVDNGEIIAQFVMPVSYPVKIEFLQEIVFRSTCFLLINSLYSLSPQTETISKINSNIFLNQIIYFQPEISFPIFTFNEHFWSELKNK